MNKNLINKVNITINKTVIGIIHEKKRIEINIQEYNNTMYSDKKIKAK